MSHYEQKSTEEIAPGIFKDVTTQLKKHISIKQIVYYKKYFL